MKSLLFMLALSFAVSGLAKPPEATTVDKFGAVKSVKAPKLRPSTSVKVPGASIKTEATSHVSPGSLVNKVPKDVPSPKEQAQGIKPQ